MHTSKDYGAAPLSKMWTRHMCIEGVWMWEVAIRTGFSLRLMAWILDLYTRQELLALRETTCRWSLWPCSVPAWSFT